ncbi:MAG: hypothetical protein ATN35_12715 [Epulopiscium sp. Nele67-Bin004]|nr:MAG: hypothetical protein ATN35_12715 [Epulopiscium sp. Nele67-Bin004]
MMERITIEELNEKLHKASKTESSSEWGYRVFKQSHVWGTYRQAYMRTGDKEDYNDFMVESITFAGLLIMSYYSHIERSMGLAELPYKIMHLLDTIIEDAEQEVAKNENNEQADNRCV